MYQAAPRGQPFFCKIHSFFSDYPLVEIRRNSYNKSNYSKYKE